MEMDLIGASTGLLTFDVSIFIVIMISTLLAFTVDEVHANFPRAASYEAHTIINVRLHHKRLLIYIVKLVKRCN